MIVEYIVGDDCALVPCYCIVQYFSLPTIFRSTFVGLFISYLLPRQFILVLSLLVH